MSGPGDEPGPPTSATGAPIEIAGGFADRSAGPCAGPPPVNRTAAVSSPSPPCYGALDLGTNNCRLLLARPTRQGFKVVDAFSRIIKLGEGVARTGRLSEEAMDRTYDALRVCALKLQRGGVTRSKLVATEACRAAANGPDFLDRVRETLGLSIEILSPENEARLAVSGCAALLEDSWDMALVFDIGGGSTELIWLDLSRRQSRSVRSAAARLDAQRCIEAWTSLPVGVVTLADRFGSSRAEAAHFDGMRDHVLSLLEPFEAKHGFRERIADRRFHLLGTSGTVTTIAGIHLGLDRYDRSRVDGSWISSHDVRHITGHLRACSHDERIAEPCIGRDRADLVLAGCAILDAILETWPCRRLRVADRGLREGILATLMAEDGMPRGHQRRPDR